MKRWRKRKSWSPHRGNSRIRIHLKAVWAGLLALAAAALLGPAGKCLAGEPAGCPPTLIVVISQLGWSQLRAAETTIIRSVLQGSTVALMPVASPSDLDADRTYVTLGAGRTAVGARIRGRAMAGGGFQVDLAPLLAANQQARTSARPGLLGTRLHALRLTTAVLAYGEPKPAPSLPPSPRGAGGKLLPYGHGGTEPDSLPPSVSVLMDEEGRVDGGRIGAAELTPLGKALDARAIGRDMAEALSRYDVVLVDLTGTGLAAADQLVGEAVGLLRARRGKLFLISPLSPPEPDPNLRTLGYVIARDFREEGKGGLFASRSTRWPGLVTAADFAPSLLSQYGGSVEGRQRSLRMGGRVMRVEPAPNAPAQLDRLDAMLTERRRLQVRVLPLYGVYCALLAASGLAAARWWPRALGRLALPGLFGALIPVGLLLAPLAGPGEARQIAGTIAVAALLCALAGRARSAPGSAGGSPASALAAVMLLGAAAICLDVVLGSHLMRLSPLGFGVLWGARFYGIGNEYAGVLGAMTLIGLGALLQTAPRKGWLAALVGLAVALVIGAPWWGANWGGYFALAAGLISLWVMLARSKLRAATGLAILVIGALGPAALDLLRPGGERSHIGMTAAALLSGQTGLVADMVMRKLVMNWRTVQQAGWWWVLSPLPIVAARAMVGRAALGRERFVCAGLWCTLVTALVAMAVNDSGLVSLASALAVTLGALVFVVARAETR